MPDPTTSQWVIVSSRTVSSEDGTIKGITTVARTIPEVFEDMALPERWGHETEHMLIRVDPNAPRTKAQKLLHDKQAQFDRSSWRRSRLENLTSKDTQAFEAMMTDLLEGQSGTQIMEDHPYIKVVDASDTLLAIVQPDKSGHVYKYCCVFTS